MVVNYTVDKLWIVHCLLGRLVSVFLILSCIDIKLCFKLFFSMWKLYSYGVRHVSPKLLVSSNVSIVVCSCYAGFNSLYCITFVVFQFESTLDLSFVLRLQVQCTTYAFIRFLESLYKNSINNYTVEVDIQNSVEFKLSDAPLTLQQLFLKLQSLYSKLYIEKKKKRKK